MQKPRTSFLQVRSSKQGYGTLQYNRSISERTLCIGGESFQTGLGTHANSEIVLGSTSPLKTVHAVVGVDQNPETLGSATKIIFSIRVYDQVIWESPAKTVGDSPLPVEIALGGAQEFILQARTPDSTHLSHANWVNIKVVTAQDEILVLSGTEKISTALPVSFFYNQTSSADWFQKWGGTHTSEELDALPNINSFRAILRLD